MATFELQIYPQSFDCASSSSSSLSTVSYTLRVRWCSSIKDIKDMLKQLTGVAPNRLFLFSSRSSLPLSHTLTLHDLGIDGRTDGGHDHLRLSILSPRSGNAGLSYFVLHAASPVVVDPCGRMLADVTRGLQRHQAPAKTDVLDCTGGVYFLRSAAGAKVGGARVGVPSYKPPQRLTSRHAIAIAIALPCRRPCSSQRTRSKGCPTTPRGTR